MAESGRAARERYLREIDTMDVAMSAFTGRPGSVIQDVTPKRRGGVLVEFIWGGKYGAAHAVQVLGRAVGYMVASMIENASNPLEAAVLAVRAERFMLERAIEHYGVEPDDGRTLDEVPGDELRQVVLALAGHSLT